ncbi:hypothetical protein IQ272_28020 [Chroococcidiopsidales cyanobacterium LEGE 13417]|nr:hypothetical protein [Chroococcidiopsidales cyanobacterium LEGE 13417]
MNKSLIITNFYREYQFDLIADAIAVTHNTHVGAHSCAPLPLITPLPNNNVETLHATSLHTCNT